MEIFERNEDNVKKISNLVKEKKKNIEKFQKQIIDNEEEVQVSSKFQ